MSGNLKGSNSFVRFLLTHGEKIGMAGIAVCAGLLIWSAVGHDRLGPQSSPDALKQTVKSAETHVASFRWKEPEKTAMPVQSEAMKPVPSSSFPPFAYGLNRPVLAPVSLRTDPVLLPPEDLEVHGDSGLWASADPAMVKQKHLEAIREEQQREREQREEAARTAENTDKSRGARGGQSGGLFSGAVSNPVNRGAPVARDAPIVQTARSGLTLEGYEEIAARSWITVLGKVPIEQQYRDYSNALQSARDYVESRDIPKYIGYQVQRAEVTDQGLGPWSKPTTVYSKTLQRERDTYPPTSEPEVIDKRYQHPILTHPLPPLILREWDKRVTHSSMPLPSELEPQGPANTELPEESKEGGDVDLFAGSTTDNRGGPLASGGGLPPGNASRRPPAQQGAAPGRTAARGTGQDGYAWDQVTPYVLLRYFDQTVKPGHRYRYRVRLALADVNHDIPEKYLEKEVIERHKKEKNRSYRFTEWSKPSPVASAPMPARIYLAGAKPANPNNPNSEPEAELLVKALNSAEAAEVARMEKFSRGSVINLHDKATVIWTSKNNPAATTEFDFHTGITLLDFSGGERLSNKNRDLTAPTRAVLMDPSGRLMLRSELDDDQPVTDYRQIVEDAKSGRRQPLGGGLR